jgi:response regulator RpfG family c-di-GMP phosphodiesterase
MVVSQAGRIDLVFSDVRMPRCSGPEFVSKAKRLRPGLKAIFTTGYSCAAGQDLFEGYEEEKSLPLIPKPYSPMDLATTVSEALQGARRLT